jgi:hypothetical protein
MTTGAVLRHVTRPDISIGTIEISWSDEKTPNVFRLHRGSWARNFGMLAVAGAAIALGILFSSKTFLVPPKTRLLLSLLATATIGFFSEFRNEGKILFQEPPSLFRARNLDSRRAE